MGGIAAKADSEPVGIGAVTLTVAAVLLLALRQSMTVPYTGLGFSPAQLVLFVGGVLWVITRVGGQRSPAGLPCLSTIIVVFLLSTALSYGAGNRVGLAPTAMAAADRYLLNALSMVTMVYFIFTVVRSRAAVERVVQGLVAGGAVSAGFGLVQFVTGIDLASQVRLPGLKDKVAPLVTDLTRVGIARVQGSAGHPLELSAVLTVLVPLAVGLTIAMHQRGARWWPWALCTGALAAGAVVTLSRSAVIGLVIGLLVMATRWPARRVGTVLAALVVFLAAGLLFGSRLLGAFINIFQHGSQDGSLQSRQTGIDYVLGHFQSHLWLGEGGGTYPWGPKRHVLDNEYLSRLMETGLVGLGVFVVLLLVAVFYAVRATGCAVRLQESGADVPRGWWEIPSGIAGALCTLIVTNSILDASGFVQIWTLTWFLIALAGVCWRLSAPRNHAEGNEPATGPSPAQMEALR